MQETTDSPHDFPQATDDEPALSPALPSTVEGLVVALAPDYFEVAVGSEIYLCTARGRLRKPRQGAALSLAAKRGVIPSARDRKQHASRQLIATEQAGASAPERPTSIATGDKVVISLLGQGRGVIEDIAPRRNVLSRARAEMDTEHVMMANVDLAALVFAVREPAPRFGLLDRYLALCERAGIPALILFNKVDLGAAPEVEQAMELYSAIGHPVTLTSAATGQGIAELREWLAGRSALLTGPSGVGKSSLMNAILPDAGQRIGGISEATGKGRHTTTGARLLPLPEGGWLADTAGIRELALWNAPAEAVPYCFVELRPVADDCEYEGCTHAEGEEGCALRAALADGRIAPQRWENFERLLDEAREKERPRKQTANR